MVRGRPKIEICRWEVVYPRAQSWLATGGTWEPAQIRRHLETAPIFIF